MPTTPATAPATATAPQSTVVCEPTSAIDIVAFARDRRAVADRAEAELLTAAAAWADLHPAESMTEAACLSERAYGDTPVTVAGLGVPLVTEFCLAEFAAALGVPTEVGKAYVGEALELRHRLPRLWARVMAGDLAAWRARRIARVTIHAADQTLTPEAAAFVDGHVAGVAHRMGPAAVDRLVEEAITRFMPDHARAAREAAADARHCTVHTTTLSFQGTMDVTATLDLADALDLDTALASRAHHLAVLGSSDTLDVRRAVAIGELARRDLTLDLETTRDSLMEPAETTGSLVEPVETAGSLIEPVGTPHSLVEPVETDAARPPRTSGRQVVLYVHLSQSALASAATGAEPARVENAGGHLGHLVTADQVREWCGGAAKVTVRPVLDLADAVPVTSYEIPDRMREQVILRDRTCVFPWCTRPARAGDVDHVISHARGGPTAAPNLAPLCRRHHRLKTHGRWRYAVIDPGAYHWTSPHGLSFVRDHTGTTDTTRDATFDAAAGRRMATADPPHPPDS